ncbi:PREDICTED: uncharacterized protein LOC105459653 isoform X2 [Wasmannia auropunctata]|uniref:uncharacterized protein LOC105459653 isoform X2 n=1 Tax=Wasmannia auropunctata TaxID=64793 RepID=UPI0005F0676A|nr:PREDICTED: uncharacterized protein LOC105459653 isoform X2 [Wasmannia auropunctata]
MNNYVRGKVRRDYRDYDDTSDLDFDDSYAENSYDDFELKNDLAVEEDDNYYIQFVSPQNAVVHSRGERTSRYDYLQRNLEAPFTRSIHISQRKNTPRWFDSDEKNLREIHDTDVQSSERRKRTKTLSRTNGTFDRETEFEQTRETAMHRDDLPNAVDTVAPSKNKFWDFIPFENNTKYEEPTFYDPRTRNHGGLQKMTPRRRRSYVFDSQSKRINIVDSEGEEEFKETLNKDSRENLSSKIPINSAKHRTSKGNVVREKILRLNTSNAISSRDHSRMPIDEQISNMYPAEKNLINTRPHSATKGKKNESPTIERREEITSATVDNRRYRDRFVNKLSNNSPQKTSRATKMFNRVADSTSNGRIYAANERDNSTCRRENAGNNKTDRINVTVSRLAAEEKIPKNESAFALRMTGASAPRTDTEKKEGKFFSRLPVRTWKRLRTKEPAALRPESDAASEDINRKFQAAENEAARSNDRPERVENDDVRGKDRAAANRNDVKRSGRFEASGSLGSDKPGLISSNLKSIKGIKDLITARGTLHEQQKKRTSGK